MYHHVDASKVHYSDPRVAALAKAQHALNEPDDDTEWRFVSFEERDRLMTGARAWLRAAVAAGLLPLVDTSTGQALSQVSLDVGAATGRPRSID